MNFKLLSLGFLCFVTSCVSSEKSITPSPFGTHPLSVVQGSTDSDETYLSVISVKKFYPLEYKVLELSAEGSDENSATKSSIVKTHWSPDGKRVIDHVHIKGLELGKLYKVSVEFSGKVIDERTFQAFDVNKKRPRIGVASCMDDRFEEESKRMWSSYLNKFVDVNFFIGDNVYADFNGLKYTKDTTIEQIWSRYLETFDKLYIYHSSSLKPTLALWDDHDYGVNDGGREYKKKEESLKLFNSFFPRYDVDGYKKTKFGAGSKLKAYGQHFLFLDGRYFREVGDPKGSHLGQKQFEFLISEIKKTKEPLWLIKGDQFFGAYHPYESYERQHPEEFKKLLSAVENSKTPVLFISGDRHLTEIMKLKKEEFNFKSYEITSSGIHAKVFKDSLKKHPNPRQLIGKSGVYNYTIIEILGSKRYKVTAYGEKNWSHYSRELVF